MSSKSKIIDLSINPTLSERFNTKYVVSPCSCWIWTGAEARGYGHLRAAYPDGWKMTRANIVSYALHKGFNEHEEDLLVCDNPACVNPDHLFLGSSSDNSDDCVSKGRQGKGSLKQMLGKNGANTLLNEDIVIRIFKLKYKGMTGAAISKELNISTAQVCRVLLRQTWKWVEVENF